jgi:hypothetical protein
LAKRGQRLNSQCPNLTVELRRNLRIPGESTERTTSPKGIIQNPRTGKNPKIPPIINDPPSTPRNSLLPGKLILKPPKLICAKTYPRLPSLTYGV